MVRLKLAEALAATRMLIVLVCPIQHASTQTTQGDLIAEAVVATRYRDPCSAMGQSFGSEPRRQLAAVARPRRRWALPYHRSPA